MRTLIIIAVIFWLIVGFAFGQNSEKSEYKISIKNNDLVVKHKGKSHKLNVADKIDAARVTDAELLFLNRKDDFTYLVVAVSGDSRDESNDRQCGAGIESNLLWIKLDSGWQTVDINSVRYESCWSSVSSGDGYKIAGNSLTIEFDNFRDDLNVKMSYNAEQPEKGFQTVEKTLDNK
jgi:hypothetical protein